MIVICGRTCAGKDTLGKWLEERHGFEKVISYTTRPPREGEADGKDYYFCNTAFFRAMVCNGDFAETTDYKQENGDIWGYGTHVNSYKDSKKKKYVILNPEGIYQLVNRNIDFDLFYIVNKNKEALKERYRNREYADTQSKPLIDEKFETRYRNREYADTQSKPLIDEKFETRWKQDEKDFNAFDEWLKKAKTEEGLPNQVKSICRISLYDKSRVSAITRKLADLGYIKKKLTYDDLEEVNKLLDEQLNELNEGYRILKVKYDALDEVKHKLEEQLEMLALRNVPLQDENDILRGELDKWKKKYEEMRKLNENLLNEKESKPIKTEIPRVEEQQITFGSLRHIIPRESTVEFYDKDDGTFIFSMTPYFYENLKHEDVLFYDKIRIYAIKFRYEKENEAWPVVLLQIDRNDLKRR